MCATAAPRHATGRTEARRHTRRETPHLGRSSLPGASRHAGCKSPSAMTPHDRERIKDLATSVAATALRAGAGTFVTREARRRRAPFDPPRDEPPPFLLFDREACPESRLVREALSMLLLDALMLPCPRDATEHRHRLRRLAGTVRTPTLVEQSSDRAFIGADRALGHLFGHYGDGRVPLRLRGSFARRTSELASAVRGVPAEMKIPSVRPRIPLELFGNEGSPGTRRAREVLASLGDPWIARARPLGSSAPDQRSTRGLPRLHDPNAHRTVSGADAIVTYLLETYGPAAKESARVDEAMIESFPASDPPSFTPR